MSIDMFGDLRDWGEVVDKIDRLVKCRELGRHQAGLVRILRYPNNWRLREMVLGCVKDLDPLSDAILSAVIDIVGDDGLYYEVRVLATRALLEWLQSNRGSFHERAATARRIAEQLSGMRSTSQPPVLCDAIHGLMAATHPVSALDIV